MQNSPNIQPPQKTPAVSTTALLAVIIASNFFNPLMGAAVNVALPHISAELVLDAVAMSWVTMAYLLASAVFLVPMGKIGDMYGRRKLFMYGNAFFLLATVLCAVSFSGYFLIFARFLQGAGSALMLSTGMAMLMSAFPPQERGKVIGLSVAAVYIGLSVAPVLGGVLTQTFGWRSIFWVNAAASVATLWTIIFKVKAEWVDPNREKFDWLGSCIYIPAMAALMYGFSKLPSLPAIGCLAFGIAGLAVFVRVELGSPVPVLNMKLFLENRVFASSNLSAFINYAATFAVSFVLSLYLQYARHLTPREAGMVLITQPILMALVAVFAGRLSDKINPRWPASLGMAISVLGLLMLAFISPDTSLRFIVAALAILGFGFGLFSAPNTTMVMSSVERNFYGVASATLSTMRTSGMMFSMAIASLAVHVYVGRQAITDANLDRFILSARAIFIVFTVLCVVGVFSSFVGKKTTQS